MIILAVAVISVLSAALTCLGTDAFSTLRFLWVFPVTAVGTFLGLILMWFVMMVIMGAAVDMKKQREKDNPFYRWVVDKTIEGLVTLLRVKIRTQGLEKTPKDGRFLLVCNHLHDTDPVVLLRCFRKSQLAFISKRENDQKFLVGPFQRMILCQPINRENDRDALRTILQCIKLLKNDEVSVGVFPEGYVSLDRLLHSFRPGVFKIAQKAKVPIVVCTLRDTHHIFANALKLKPSQVELHLLDVIGAQELEGVSTVEIAERVHKMMADDLGPELVLTVDS